MMAQKQDFITPSGIAVLYEKKPLDIQSLADIADKLEKQKGMALSSGIEYPGRYNRWELGFFNPPLELVARKGTVVLEALNPRGQLLLKLFLPIFQNHADLKLERWTKSTLELSVNYDRKQIFPEDQRSRQASVATPLRIINSEMKALKDNMLGLFGAFAYDMIFEFEPCQLNQKRTQNDKLFHLFFVDTAYIVDKQKDQAFKLSLEFLKENKTTLDESTTPFYQINAETADFKAQSAIETDLTDKDYAELVKSAKEEMQLGNIFELVYSRIFHAKVTGSRAQLYRKLKNMNPSPYEFYCQFGDEQLIGTSPEMFVRCEGDKVESCPISGTIRRGANAMEDERQIRRLLNSDKDEVELTMCTDVDRNDKARICEPSSIELVTRRTIERYVGLFHTVDHVKGTLKKGFNGLDAFLSHMWAVTLTGAPKKRAIELIEKNEQSPRRWYGGAVGCLGFNGDVNSTITIRTVHLKDDMACYRSGATLVWDSDPIEEAKETITKATTFYRALDSVAMPRRKNDRHVRRFDGVRALMIDHEDSFVHTLVSYFETWGVTLKTYRAGQLSADDIIVKRPDLVIYSPGPGKPDDFKLPAMIKKMTEAGIPQFGVCLGLQGMFEAFGGRLKLLDVPRHGKTWQLVHEGDLLFDNIPVATEVGAYHSIIADSDTRPEVLEIIARNEQGDIMAIRHRTKPLVAVQFHPESILSLHEESGLRLIHNVLKLLCH